MDKIIAVVTIPANISREEAEKLRHDLQAVLGDVYKAVILTGGATMQLLHRKAD